MSIRADATQYEHVICSKRLLLQTNEHVFLFRASSDMVNIFVSESSGGLFYECIGVHAPSLDGVAKIWETQYRTYFVHIPQLWYSSVSFQMRHLIPRNPHW
jgi:hypothetical protein